MTRILLVAVAAACLAWGDAAIAQPHPDGPPPGDGPPGAGFGRLFISPMGEPFRGPDGERRWFDGADANHDGVLTLDEFRADGMRFFKVVDRNGDGVVDGIENQAYETEIVPEITRMGFADEGPGRGRFIGGGGRGEGPGGGMRRGRGGGGGGRGGGDDGPSFGGPRRGGGSQLEGAARFSLLNIPQPVRGADLDLDWKVSAQEWAKAAGQRFALLDKDHAGKLTFDALPPLPGRRSPKPAHKPS